MIYRSALPRGVNPMVLDKRARMNTLAGTYESGGEVMLKGLRLPEFDRSRNIEPWKKKVDAILQMEPRKNIKQMRSFWGL